MGRIREGLSRRAFLQRAAAFVASLMATPLLGNVLAPAPAWAGAYTVCNNYSGCSLKKGYWHTGCRKSQLACRSGSSPAAISVESPNGSAYCYCSYGPIKNCDVWCTYAYACNDADCFCEKWCN